MKKILVYMTAIMLVVSAYTNPTMVQASDLQTEIGYTTSTVAQIPSGNKTPVTGDVSNLNGILIVLGISTGIISVLLFKRIKEELE